MSFTWSPLLATGALSGTAVTVTALPQTTRRPTYPVWRPRSREYIVPVTSGTASQTLASGTTIAALQAGSVSIKYTVAIEGCPYLLTDATAQQAVDAWHSNTSTHHYNQALPGLFITGDMGAQQLDWRNPFPRGGTLMLHVSPDASDTFGKYVFKRDAGNETELTVTADRDDTTLTVKSTTGFDSSGELWIGTECIGYTGKTATTFTGCTRGKYAPMARTDGTSNDGFAQTHRVGQNALEVLLNPRVTSVPRKWPGKWVAVYVHKYDPSIPALNSRANSLRAFCGKIVSVTDDPATGCTVLEVKHVLDVIAEHTVGGRDQWSGRIRNVIFLAEGMTFSMEDANYAAGTEGTADVLEVVASGASGNNEINEGYYTPIQVYEKLNAWWAAEKGLTNLLGFYSIGYYTPSDGTIKSYIWWQISGATGVMAFRLQGPQLVLARLGFESDQNAADVNGFQQTVVLDAGNGGAYRSKVSANEIERYVANNHGAANSAIIDDEQGTFKDQYAFLPGASKPATTADDGYGIFLVDEKFLIVASYDSNGGPDSEPILNNFAMLPEQFGLPGENVGNFWQLPLRRTGPQDTAIRQIFVLEMALGDALIRIFESTGTNAYNSPYDTLAHGLGIGIPGEILPADFRASCNALPHADEPVVLLIDKQIKLSTLLAGELILRRAFLRWITAAAVNDSAVTGFLEFKTWQSPTSSNSVGTLTEANKAAPSGNVDHHRSVTTEDTGWAVPTVNVRFNRALNGDPAGKDQYRDTLTIADKAALDDAGGDGPSMNIDCRGTFGDFMQTGQDPNSLAAGFMSTMPFFSQPGTFVSRSIDQRYFAGYSIGDVFAFSDEYARDPATGARGVQTRYAIVTRHRYSLGGLAPNSDNPAPQGGDADLFVLAVNRVAAYVPSAQVDDTQTNAGYTDATKTLICYAHKYSESTESVDASNFAAGDKVRIIEIDPSDPAAPDYWDRVIDTVSSNSIALTVALSSPAWDSAKKYRIVFDDYSDAVTAQQLKTFQADATDGMIQDSRAAFEYGIGGGDGVFTRWAATDTIELPANAVYGDGVGRDVGHDVALARLLNNLVMYKTGVSSPCLSNDVLTYMIGGGTSTWCLVQCRPVKLGDDVLLGDCYRNVAVAPWYRSGDGSSATVRVTLSRTPPTSSSYFDVDRGAVIDSTTWTTTSTTWQTGTVTELNGRVKGGDGTLWVYVEISATAETRGLAHFQETSIKLLHSFVTV